MMVIRSSMMMTMMSDGYDEDPYYIGLFHLGPTYPTYELLNINLLC